MGKVMFKYRQEFPYRFRIKRALKIRSSGPEFAEIPTFFFITAIY
jgi:hypothetical protein